MLFRVLLEEEDLEDDREYGFNPILEMTGNVLREVRRTVFRPAGAEDGTAEVSLDDTRNLLNPNLVTYSFAFNENKGTPEDPVRVTVQRPLKTDRTPSDHSEGVPAALVIAGCPHSRISALISRMIYSCSVSPHISA
ncbi:MAG: hypothetical protein J6Z45_02100 [Oscillospiraceae bacterium]|nr:hypothetical protein [Oscillospiraceae bacterium]